jgi:hypothetical protein
LEVIDDRGNVVVVIEGGGRIAGTLCRVSERVTLDDNVDVTLLIGDELATLALVATAAATVRPGAVIAAAVLGVDMAGLRLSPPPLPPHHRPGLTGDLGDVPMAELIQLLCAARRTATVDIIVDDEVMGTLAFADGRAISARTENGVCGIDAFYALAAFEVGAFEVFYGRTVSTADLTEDTLYLLLEAARRADEARRVVDQALVPASLDAIADAFDAMASDDIAIASAPPVPEPAVRAMPATPPPLPRREAKSAPIADDVSPGDPTEPVRPSAAASGLFSGFFSEFSAARAREARPETRAEPRTEASARAAPARPSADRRQGDRRSQPRHDGRAEKARSKKPDDVANRPPFASLSSLAFQGDVAMVGDRDTDIVSRHSNISAN